VTPSVAALEPRRPLTDDALPTGPTLQPGTRAAARRCSVPLRESVVRTGSLTHDQLREDDVAAPVPSAPLALQVDGRPWGSTDVTDEHRTITVDGVPGARVVCGEGFAPGALGAPRTLGI
jgi:hypothetical protein